MAPAKKSWIWTGSQGYSPDGYLQIGQVLTDPRDPASALMTLKPLALPKGTILDGNKETGVTLDSNSQVTASFNAWAEVVEAPAKVSASGSKEKTTREIWYIDEVEEKHTILNLPYIRKAMNTADVKEHYKTHFWIANIFRRLYIVTGVRIARGAELLSVTVDKSGVSGTAIIDGNAVSVPLKTGMRVAFKRDNKETRGASATNFVWAYRLNEVNFAPIRKKPYDHGDTQAIPDDEDGQSGDSRPELQELQVDDETPLEGEFEGETGDEEKFALEDGDYFLDKGLEDSRRKACGNDK